MDTIKYRKGYKYQLHESTVVYTKIIPSRLIQEDYYTLGRDGVLIVKAGYAWDGASGPVIDTLSVVTASLVHDVLYQMIRQEQLPEYFKVPADDEFYRLCRVNGAGRFRSWLFRYGLGIFGGPSANPRFKRKIHEAPALT